MRSKSNTNHVVSKVLMSLAPMLVLLILQMLIGAGYWLTVGLTDVTAQKTGDLSVVYIVTGLVEVAVFSIWYRKLITGEHVTNTRSVLNLRSAVSVLLIAVGVSAALSFGEFFAIEVVPQWISDSYESAINQVITYNALTCATVTVLCPIGEELVFRGVTLKLLKRTGAPFWVCNIIQAFLFALMHFNVIQSTYTFILGIVCGYLVYRFKSVAAGIVTHMVFNILGYLCVFGYFINCFKTNTIILIAASALFLAAAAAGFVILRKVNAVSTSARIPAACFSSYFLLCKAGWRILFCCVLPAAAAFIGLGAAYMTRTNTKPADMYCSILSTISALMIVIETNGDYFAFGGITAGDKLYFNLFKVSGKGRSVIRSFIVTDNIARIGRISLVVLISSLSYIYLSGDVLLPAVTLLYISVILTFTTLYTRKVTLLYDVSFYTVPFIIAAVGGVYSLRFIHEGYVLIILAAVLVIALLFTVRFVNRRFVRKTIDDRV